MWTGRRDRRTDSEAGVTKLIVASCNFSNSPKNVTPSSFSPNLERLRVPERKSPSWKRCQNVFAKSENSGSSNCMLDVPIFVPDGHTVLERFGKQCKHKGGPKLKRL
jgi:hypothetical protein